LVNHFYAIIGGIMIQVAFNGEHVYSGRWQDAPDAVRQYCQHLADANNDVGEYFRHRPALALAMKGYTVAPLDLD
jgi:hypothetical protein